MSEEVLREARQRVERGERVALATVVATRGSTPQKVGARLLVRRDGSTLGTLGGGAVEAEALREAGLRLEGGPPVLREHSLSTGTDEWGLACGGTMLVFIEPLEASALDWLRAVTAAAAANAPVALVTMVEGSAAGARLLVRGDGTDGSFGDPALDREAAALGQRVLEREHAELASRAGAGLYAEPFGPQPTLVVVGAGHVGKALAALGKFLGVRVWVIDDRPEYATRARFPEADEVIAAPAGEAVGRLQVTPRTAIVVAMRNHDLDYEATAAALHTRAGYVGLVGSERKAILVAKRLLADGLPPERVKALRSPVGLDIGGRTPEEIALAILGEWIMLRKGGGGAPMQLSEELLARVVARSGSTAGGLGA